MKFAALGRLTSSKLTNPFGAKICPLLDVQTIRVASGTPVFAAALSEGIRSLAKTKWPTTFVPCSSAVG